MTNTFAIITPSYEPDFGLCSLLKESIAKHIETPHTHYIIVEEKEKQLFSSLKEARTEILSIESLLPWWIFRLPYARRWWLSLGSMPIRNWILQQIVKLSVGKYLKEDNFIFIDSDNAFIRPFDLNDLIHTNCLRLFRMPGEGNIESHYKWHRVAGKLLDVPIQDYYGARYIGNIITWRKENLLKLYSHIESKWNRPWIFVLANQWNLSEYILYGVFAHHILKEKSQHFDDNRSLCLEYWLEKKMSPHDVEKFTQMLKPHHVGVMLSAKARMPTVQHRKIIKLLEEKV